MSGPRFEMEIRGKHALVTGGGGGIGRAIALGLAGAGVRVGVVDISGDAAAATAELITGSGAHGRGFAADLSTGEGVRAAMAAVTGEVGAPDILVNSVGIYPRAAVADMAEEEWDRVHATNLKSAFLMCRAVVPGMVERGYGRILSISSSLGNTGVARGAHYAASKAGLDALMRSLSAEVSGNGVRVNNISPGLTDTAMMRGANTPEYIEKLSQQMPDGRLGQPTDIVGLVLFLCSEAAIHITGQVYNLR